MRRSLLLICAALIAACCSPPAGASERTVASGTRAPQVLPAQGAAAAAAGPSTWIVGARPGAAARSLGRRYGARLISARGSFVVPRRGARAFVAALRRAGVYTFSEPDALVHAKQVPPTDPVPVPPPPDEFATTDWRAFLIGPTLVPPTLDHAPLTAIIDSPVDLTHPDLAGVQATGDPVVMDLHGTAVASVIAGRANGTGMVGVYPGAPLLAVGSGLRMSDITSAIAAAVAAKAKVINLSLGSPSPSYAMFVELAYAVSQGILPVAAAGNDFDTVLPDGTRNPVEFPAAFPHVLSVASIGPEGASSDFSTANGAVDLSAPGESVLAAVPGAFDDDGVADGYERVSGTSFAAPIAAGAAAWLMAARPNLSAAQVADALRWSATDADKAGWDTNTGYGVVNVAAALAEPDPAIDSTEVNDDVEWVNGDRFSRADGFLFRTYSRSRYITGAVDTWKDPADVYRIEVAPRARVTVRLQTIRRSDPDLAVFRSTAKTIYGKRNRIGASFLGAGRTDVVTLRNKGRRRAVAYVAVYAPRPEAAFLDATYTLTVKRLKR